MANPTSTIQRNRNLADTLAVTVSDGTIEDVVGLAKVDASGKAAPASQARYVACQLNLNAYDDAWARVVEMYYASAKVWSGADLAALQAFGSDDQLAAGDLGFTVGSPAIYSCASVDGASSSTWSLLPSGDVTGPASSTDNAIVRYDGTTGKLIQNSTATIDDAGAMSVAGPAPISASANADDLTVGDGVGARGISVFSANNLSGNIYFADPDSATSGLLRYNHFADRFEIGVAGGFKFNLEDDNISPLLTNAYDIGTSTYAWRTGYFETSLLVPLVQSRDFGAGAGSGNPLTVRAGDGGTSGSGSDGGDLTIRAGDAQAGNSAGGTLALKSGASNGSSDAGDIELSSGLAPGSGADLGVVRITNTGLEIAESASTPGRAITAGNGRYWVEDTTPSTPKFTDDAGGEHTFAYASEVIAQVVWEQDWAALADSGVLADGAVDVGGKSFTLVNSANCGTKQITNGAGLQLTHTAGTNTDLDNGIASGSTGTYLHIPLNTLAAECAQYGKRIRLWAYFSAYSVPDTGNQAVFGIGIDGTFPADYTVTTYASQLQNGTTDGPGIKNGTTEVVGVEATTSDNVIVFDSIADGIYHVYYGQWSSGWPAFEDLRLAGRSITAGTTGNAGWRNPDAHLMIGIATNSASGSPSFTLARTKIEIGG